MQKTSLTIADISRVTGFPESTVRFYRDKFHNYIPYRGEGRKRRYEPAAIKIFEEISNLSSKGLAEPEILHYLSSNYAHNPIIVDEAAQVESQGRNHSVVTTVEPHCDKETILPKLSLTAESQFRNNLAVTAMEPQYMLAIVEMLIKNKIPETEKIYLTVKEASFRTGISQESIKEHCRQYLQSKTGIPCTRTGRGYVIHKNMLDNWFTKMIRG
ncbi:MerR family transcriptional regulator [Desulforamulus aeronauticus]|uniref:MerR HTH family regulatory protein n=1 Tax=Desulforamulus aeronauticus DSM 10349 TaxID=1121421 RepID=A0A1M6WEJ8_9FIRM|nr:MerR family transcriptional regulator [Desulforamulus aeronauticus]SHK92099.1 MerR HTH family regulatory protein [Desulforamulus aeronauticus DSM 10349]